VRADSIAAVRLSPGVAWGAGDDRVELAILIAVRPGGAGGRHLKTIAALSRKLVDDEFRERLLAAPDDAALAALLAQAAGAAHPPAPETRTTAGG
jgi:PTS system fructose-specific IIC component